MSGLQLVERDSRSGEVLGTIVEAFGAEATFDSDFTLDAERSRLFHARFVEDSWFSCQSSPGSVEVVDLGTGERTQVGLGTSPALSPDGSTLAYIAASECLPDPDEPQFVITPYDTVVVVDLAGGTRVEHRLPAVPQRWDAPEALAWVGFDADGSLLVATNVGLVHRLDPSELTGPPIIPTARGVVVDLGDARPIDVADGSLVATVVGDEGSEDLVAYDLAIGESSILATSEYRILVGVSDGGVPVVGHDARDAAPTVVTEGSVQLVPLQPEEGFDQVLGGIDG